MWYNFLACCEGLCAFHGKLNGTINPFSFGSCLEEPILMLMVILIISIIVIILGLEDQVLLLANIKENTRIEINNNRGGI
uniref:Uncharacterized protein n=1 Tax=Physcomitrium patens TaxID=3218 RepID=A0A2K1IRW0_PHYPA|nr:hypothetical protein PHYPA_026138 [Physcomitrium patens]